jgi:hypothetical protein
MSTLGLFRKDGDLYAGIPLDLLALDSDLRSSATEVMAILVTREREGRLDERLTDKDIAAALDRSVSFVQKGLHTLTHGVSDVLDKIIVRTQARGRRTIEFVRGLRGSQRDKPDPTPPPAPPPPEQRNKTTTAASSSSLSHPLEPTDGPDPTVARALFERAKQLVDGVSLGAIASAIADFTADSVRRALDWIEKRHRHARKDWGYVRGILTNKARTGWPEEAPDPAAAEARRKAEDRARAEAEAAAERAKEERLRRAWGLLPEAEKESIKEAVDAANPTIRQRFPTMFGALCLAELERRHPAEEARAP